MTRSTEQACLYQQSRNVLKQRNTQSEPVSSIQSTADHSLQFFFHAEQ